MKFKKIFTSLATFIIGINTFGQATGPSLEFSRTDSDGNPNNPSGVVFQQAINFNLNANNPSSNTFTIYNPSYGKLSATFKIINSYNGGIQNPPVGFTLNSFNNFPLVIGATNNGVGDIYRNQGLGGTTNTANANYTSAAANTGAGFDNTSNFGVEFCLFTNGLNIASTGQRIKMTDIEITFSRPVTNPIIHFNGLGGKNGSYGFSTEFDVLDQVNGNALSITRLSGKDNFVITSNKVTNSSSPLGSAGDAANATSGSVRINGQDLTKIILTTYVRGDSGTAVNVWGYGSGANSSDAFTLGLAVAESDLQITKTVDNTTPTIGNNVTFTITAKNNGPSNNTNVKVQDLLPTGYTYVSSNVPSGTTYNITTGLWTIGDIGATGATQNKILTITAKVNSTGNYTNTATINGDLGDPLMSNNSASATVTPACPAGTTQVPLTKTVLSNYDYPISQELFFDDFGTSDLNTNKGRKTTPYMPSGSFIFGNSFANLANNPGTCNGTNGTLNQARINDGYYAVVAPGYIKKGWYYTANGASVNDCWGYWWTSAYDEANTVKDYSGTTTGAALVINAGTVLRPFYNRNANVQVGAKYKASYQLYIVNTPSRVAIDIIDVGTNSVIATYTSPTYNGTSDAGHWIPVTIEFTMPGIGGSNSCVSRDVILSFRNNYSEENGNDWYVDNLKVEKIQDAPSCPPANGCVTTNIDYVNLNSAYSGTPPAGSQLVWFTTSTRDPGTEVTDPTHVTASGLYYAFFYHAGSNCYNADVSTVTVTIYPKCTCTKPGSLVPGGTPTKVGITNQTKLSIWPQAVPNGHITLESKTNGFVITRVANSGAIAAPKKGMLIYDIAASCVKLYNGTVWKCIQRGCNE